MTTENWNDKYVNSEDDWCHTFVTTVHQIFKQLFPLVQLSRQRLKEKPWITKGLKISIKHKNRLYKSQLLRPGQQQLVNIIDIKIFSAKAWRKRRQIITRRFLIVTKSVYNIWKTLNPIINPKAWSKSTFINQSLIDRKVIKDQNNISDAMNNHFCTIKKSFKGRITGLGSQISRIFTRKSDEFFLYWTNM